MFNLRNTLSSLLICGSCLLAAHSAFAQPHSDATDSCAAGTPDAPAADELFKLGAEFYKRGDLAGAAKKFTESYCLWPSAKTLQVLAQCHENQSKFASAYSEYKRAAELAQNTRRSGVEADCNRRADEIAARRSFLTLRVLSAVPGLAIARNGTHVGESQYGLRLPIDPGEYVITAHAPGYVDSEQHIPIGANADDKVVVISSLQPLPQPQQLPQPQPQPSQPQPTKRLSYMKVQDTKLRASVEANAAVTDPWPWVLGGVGAATLLMGGVSGALALRDKGRIDSACHNESPCSASQALGIQSRRDFEWTMARVTVPLGLSGIIGAATWLTLGSFRRERAAVRASMSGLVASLDERGGTLWVQGRFQ